MRQLLLKTYGKQKRKLSAWISPENRRRAFDSTASSDGDKSVFEPARPTKTRRVSKASVPSGRAGRLAKQKAMQSLIEKSFDDENIINTSNVIIPCPPHPPPAQERKTRRGKKLNVCSGRTVRPARRKTECLTMNSSDEENIGRPSPLHPQQSKITSVHPPSVCRFVTHRRRAGATKPQRPKSHVVIFNSSDDFSSGALCSSRILRPSRRRRVPPTFTVSSAEKSMNPAGTSSLATNPLREISLNESSDHSLGLSSRKPIFCSTPSANPFSKHPRLKPYDINDQSSTPQSMSVSCIGVLSPFQQDVDSPQQPITPCHSARPIGLPFEEKPQSSFSKQQPDLHHLEEPSGDLFMEAKSTNRRISSSEHTTSHSEDIKTKSGGESPDTTDLWSDSDSSSYFVSAATGLEWLIEALKEECLTEHCTVQLVRLDILKVTQLCNQTTYSSCLGAEQSIHCQQTNEHQVSVNSSQTVDYLQSSEASFNLNLSVTNNKNSAYFVSVNSFGSSEQAVSVTDSLSCNNSSSAHCKLSPEFSSTREFMEQSSSVLHGESSPHTNSHDEFIVNTQLPANSSSQSVVTKEDMQQLKDKCLAKKCTIELKKKPFSQLPAKQRLTQQKESDDRSGKPAAKMSEDDSTHNLGNPGDPMSVKRSINNSSELAQTRCNDPETKELLLKKKCLTKKLYVDMKRVNLSELKEIVKLKDTFKSPTVVSDLPSDDQMSSDHQSEQDINHCHKDTFSMKANMRKRSSISSEDKISIDKEAVKRSCDILPKRKKMSVAPKEKKRRSASTDQPGTTRKACVSGLSVNRWKNKCNASSYMFRSQTAKSGSIKAVDSSINELISTQHKRPTVLGAIMNFSTPVKATPLNLSSLLADITPNTNTWSRLKAAISVHRKVLLTPRTPVVSKNAGMANLADISQDLFGTPSQTPLSKHLRSQLLRHDSLAVCEDVDLSDAEKVYAECGQQRPLPWKECILPQRMKRCVKIGEGTFGEVFSTTKASGDTVALKIIPVEGSKKVNGEDQKTLGEILHEIIISKELSSLKEKQQNQTHGFIGLNDLHCVQGCYPPELLKAWDRFDQKKGSENDRPDFFENDQLFIVLEFEFGGIDLENSNGTLASLGVAKSILHQVTAALAVAEQELQFEHRDLHWGNILVKTTKEKTGSFLLNGTAHFLETKGVLVRIIDYSLSRLEIDELTVSCDISKDEELFMGQGDYQFEIYRLMRKENGNNWSDYHPHTNVLWLHYLCSKLLSMKYRGSRGRGAKDLRQELARFYDNILHYRSATEVLQNCPMFQ